MNELQKWNIVTSFFSEKLNPFFTYKIILFCFFLICLGTYLESPNSFKESETFFDYVFNIGIAVFVFRIYYLIFFNIIGSPLFFPDEHITFTVSGEIDDRGPWKYELRENFRKKFPYLNNEIYTLIFWVYQDYRNIKNLDAELLNKVLTRRMTRFIVRLLCLVTLIYAIIMGEY